MAKQKPAPLPVTTDTIGRAAQTNAIRDLVCLADAFYRAGAGRSFTVELPLFTSVHLPEKGYRKMNIPIGTKLGTLKVSIGKRDGLIFAFDPQSTLQRDGITVGRVEMGWDDVVNSFETLADEIEKRLATAGASKSTVKGIDAAIKETVAKNPSMHTILTEGFSIAQTHSKQVAADSQLEDLPEFGMF